VADYNSDEWYRHASTLDVRPYALVRNARRSARKYEALMNSLSIEEGKQGKKPNDAKRKSRNCSGMYSLPLWRLRWYWLLSC